MASHLELMEREVRGFLNENLKSRYLRFTTTSAGAANGSTIISTDLYGQDAAWAGTEVEVLSGTLEGQSRIAESFTNSTDTLDFSNNKFPAQVASGISCELYESKIWSGKQIRSRLIQAINTLAGLIPKAMLKDYIVKETVGSVAGVADPPASCIDLHGIFINSLPAVPVPIERMERLISGRDKYANPTTTTRYFYLFEGKDSTNGQLRHFPSVNATISYHKVPYMSGFETSGATYFPAEFHSAAAAYAAYLSYLANRDLDFAQSYRNLALEKLQALGIKATKTLRQESA